MTLNEEQIRKDDERWGYLDVIKELKYSGLELKHRLNTTDDDLHYHAWLHRASLNCLQEYAPVVHGYWEPYYHVSVLGRVTDGYQCSKCGEGISYDEWGDYHFSKYCPECGAKMDESEGK